MVPTVALQGIGHEEAAAIVETALADPRTLPVHGGRAYTVIEVSRIDESAFGPAGRYARVVIEFDDPLPAAAWPGDACDIGRESNDITGITWLLSFETGAVAAVSPQWDYAIDCLHP